MSGSSAMRVSANFVAFFYKRLADEPASLAGLCGPTTKIMFNSHQGKKEKFSNNKETSEFFSKQPKGAFRVVVATLDPTEAADGQQIEVFVCGSVVNAATGHTEYHFEHMFDLRRNGTDAKSYYIASLTMQHNEHSSHAPATETKKAHEPKLSWADSTPPMFAKESPPEPVPAFDVGPSVTRHHADPIEPPKHAEVKSDPPPEVAKPSTKEKAAKGPKPASPKEPEAEVAPVKEPPVATKEVESASAAEPTEKPAPPAATGSKSLADMMRERKAGGAAPAAPTSAPVPTEKAKPEKAASKTSPAPPVAEEPKPVEKPAAPKPATPPPAPVAAPVAAAAVATEEPTSAPAAAPSDAKTGQKSVWGSKTLTFTGSAVAEHKPAVVIAPEAKTVKASSAPKPAVSAPAAAPAAAAPTTEVARPSAAVRSQPVPAINYHIFIKGLPEGTTEEEICEMLKPHMQLKRPLKIEQKNVQEPNREGTLVDKVRTFGFALIDGPEAEIERRRKVVVGKQFKIRGQNVYVDEVREKAAYLPRK